jgi:hypothetical protein
MSNPWPKLWSWQRGGLARQVIAAESAAAVFIISANVIGDYAANGGETGCWYAAVAMLFIFLSIITFGLAICDYF